MTMATLDFLGKLFWAVLIVIMFLYLTKKKS